MLNIKEVVEYKKQTLYGIVSTRGGHNMRGSAKAIFFIFFFCEEQYGKGMSHYPLNTSVNLIARDSVMKDCRFI